MSDEKLSSKQQHEKAIDQRELEQAASQAQERISEQHERQEARSPEKNASEKLEARADALEQAESAKKPQEKLTTRELSPEKRPRGKRNKHELDASYKEVMSETRSQMPAANRAFSKVIHNRAIEATSEAVGSTLARPNAILAGSLSAFVIVLGAYLVARHYGYQLSGSETLIAFAAGWLIGIIFDFFRTMITGKR